MTGGGPNGVLMWTDDLNGADAQAWLAYASEVLRIAPATPTGAAESPRGPVRRVAKKAVARPKD